jgi:hypothetical protein
MSLASIAANDWASMRIGDQMAPPPPLPQPQMSIH